MEENEGAVRKATRQAVSAGARLGAKRLFQAGSAAAGSSLWIWLILGFLFLAGILFILVLSAWTILTSSTSEQGGVQQGQITEVKYAEVINQAATEFGVNPALVAAVIRAESNFDPKASSHKGAQGLMQVMPMNAKGANLSDPEENIMRGTQILASHLQRYENYDNRLELSLAAYNAGAGAVAKHGNEVPPYPETQDYVKKVLNYYEQYQAKVEHGQLVLADGEWTHPAPGTKNSSHFGIRKGKPHRGEDFAGDVGTPIRAAADGVVQEIVIIGDRSYGTLVRIDHGGGIHSLYAHMYPDDIQVHAGDPVQKGQQIGKIGNYGRSTGPHLHFEIRENNEPVDPKPYLADVLEE